MWHGGFTTGSSTRQAIGSKKASFKMSAFERVGANDGTNSGGSTDFVKWSKEVINTCPDNFELSKFEDDSSAIEIKTPGIYEIVFTFFVP